VENLAEKAVHSVGDLVVYKNNGICRIADIRPERLGPTEKKDYYILAPVNNEHSQIFIPVDSPIVSAMKSLLTPEEIDEIISSVDNNPLKWIDNPKDRFASSMSIIDNGSRREILCLYLLITYKEKEMIENKKKLWAKDARILSIAEKMITDEFSYVLNIEKSEVIEYIASRIKK